MPVIQAFAADVLACLRFYTRLPIPVFAFEPAPHDLKDFGRAIRATPLAGAIVGGIGAIVLLLGALVRLPASVTAALALAALVLTTGVFHEDGLADTADGLGGGATRVRKLEIMKDSRVGSYGAMALALSLLLRWATLTAILEDGAGLAVAAIVAANATSRATGLIPLALLNPARADGAAFAAAKPLPSSLAVAAILAFLFGLLPIAAGFAPGQMLLAMVAAVAAALAMTEIARRQIGGQTGDIAGAAQQLAEIAMLCVLSARI
jgi:adenosylcobinamide-GDP ribazoletransferase